METWAWCAAGILVACNVTLALVACRGRATRGAIGTLAGEVKRLEEAFREECRQSRAAAGERARLDREELGRSLNRSRMEQQAVLHDMATRSSAAIESFERRFSGSMDAFSRLQREKLEELTRCQRELLESTGRKLEEMRATVDEKLQRTLHERIGQSFELVGKQLESVQKGLGEMQSLAQEVGGLKRVLGNVKTRGSIGEVQLEMLLEQLLAPDQYERNVKTRRGSDAVVEFAIKLPGHGEGDGPVYLPVDAKFPKEVYEQFLDACDAGEARAREATSRALEQTIRGMARDIRDKYLDVPRTTDFGIMFLPFESIYGEVTRRAALLEQLQREFHVIVTGPTTLAAILNSLQMGFRTLAIQKRSGEVWRVLGAVKTEFEKFGGLLEKAQKNIHAANEQIEEVMGKRTRAIQRELRHVEALPAEEGPAG